MIFDDFFEDPVRVRALINESEMRDRKYSDGVVYPNITELPESVKDELYASLTNLVGEIDPVLEFARYSFDNIRPPHWAHSDREIAGYLALIYLTPDKEAEKFGTCTLKHRALGFEIHPETETQKDILLSHANSRNDWDVMFSCPAKFNRLLILNAELIHASLGEFGKDKTDGRLVISSFFNLRGPE